VACHCLICQADVRPVITTIHSHNPTTITRGLKSRNCSPPIIGRQLRGMLASNDFSTNCSFSGPGALHTAEPLQPTRFTGLCFDDGNLAILSGQEYFLVYRGLLCRHSAPFASMIKSMETKSQRSLEGRPVLELPDPSKDLYAFLLALHDGM
jgi:hypothetical protein